VRVLIRADASLAIGSGHVARCLTLAHVLHQYGAQVAFACRQLPGNRLESLQAQGFQTFALPDDYPQEHPQEHPGQGVEALLPWQAEIAELQRVLSSEQPFDWIIVDHYGLDHHWQTAARQWAKQIAVIDDLANRHHAADLLLDQNLTATAQAYGPLIDARCQTLLGPRFALLCKELREELRREPIPIKAQPRRVLVNFGGFDAVGETWKAMQAMAGFTEQEVDFVAGVDNPAWTQMQAMAASRPHWRLHSYVSDFARLMAQADLFVGAGGGTSWERAGLGLPTVCIAVAANQQRNAERLASAGAHVYLGTSEQVTIEQLRQAIGFLLGNYGLRQSLAERSRQLVDGLGAQRVAVALSGSALQLRPATIDDARLLFAGRNAPSVRRWAVRPEEILWESHQAWFAASLCNPQRLLLIASAADGPVGVLRYDRDQARAEVSIYLFEGRSGLGWGRVLLARGEAFVAALWPDLRFITAQVLADNQPSLSLFRRAGYQQNTCEFRRALKDHPND
jgi:UDP-2,4-diacetamido-2,4,6-trideoxy-beta-L-altropyranose hydrolase